MSDLQPYICTYSDCQLHEYFFDNLDDWFRHESRTHRMEWFCNTDSHQSFVDQKDFLDHMHTVHSEPLDETQLLNLHRGLQRPSNAHSGTCTLCGQHASRLKSHLARHLEQLALFAIPQTDYMAIFEEDDTSSNAARQGVPAISSIGSTRVASDPSSHDSSSEASVSRSGSASRRMRHVRAAAYDRYNKQDEEAAMTSSEDIQEEVDTSWDQITPKFKDARVRMYNEQEVENSRLEPAQAVMVVWDEPPPPPRDSVIPRTSSAMPPPTPPPPKAPPSLRERASRITSNIFSPFRSSKLPYSGERSSASRSSQQFRREHYRFPEIPGESFRNADFEAARSHYSQASVQDQSATNPNYPSETSLHMPPSVALSISSMVSDSNVARDIGELGSNPTVAPSIARTNSEASFTSSQPPRLYPDSRPTEGINTGEKRSWRQRLSKAIGIRSKSPISKPNIQLPYNPTVSDLPDDVSIYGPSEVSENLLNDNPAFESSGRETRGLDADKQTVARYRLVIFCHECSRQWYRDEDGLSCPNCGSEFTELVEQAGSNELS